MENPFDRWAWTKIAELGLLLVFASAASVAQGRIDCSAVNSRILHRSVRYCALLPPSYGGREGTKYAVLYFLHGLGENEQALIASGGWGVIEDLLEEHQVGDFIVIAPQGGSSFFINSAAGGERYSDFFLSEFLPYIENHYRVVKDRRRRGITGLSMGGYGALRFAFAHPEIFASVSTQSPALITESPAQINRDMRTPGPLARSLGTVFGNPIDVRHWQENNPFDLARRKPIELKQEAIYINCGAEDELGFAQGAVKLHQQLLTEGIRHEFHLYPGGHNAEYFLSHLGETIRFHARVFQAAGAR
jgi:S-formylglutathione hydrolase FrmB